MKACPQVSFVSQLTAQSVGQNNYILVPADGISLLSAAMTRIADDRALTFRLKNQNNKMVKDYSIDVICENRSFFFQTK